MLDLETLGTAATAPVLSIGACYFNPATGDIGKKFHGRIDASDTLRYGRMSGETFKWWMGQSDDARQKVLQYAKPAAEVFTAFEAFLQIGGINIVPWGNGSSFDITILEVSFPRVLDRPAPWKFWNVRDCRTIKDIANSAGHFFRAELEGTAHSALDDALFQAKWVSHYWQKLVSGAKADDRPPEAPSANDDLDLLG